MCLSQMEKSIQTLSGAKVQDQKFPVESADALNFLLNFEGRHELSKILTENFMRKILQPFMSQSRHFLDIQVSNPGCSSALPLVP